MRKASPKFVAPSIPQAGLLLAAVCVLSAGGCADGFIPEARSLNPYVRKQWDEDEKRGPTYYKRMEELRQVRAQAHQLPAPEKQRLAKEIVDVLAIEKSPTVRAELAKTLAVLPGPASLVALEGVSTDNDPDVRAAACQALAGQQGPEAVKLLAQLNGDADLDVRMEAARALGRHKSPEAVKALALSLEENDPAIQRVAMESLKSSTGKDFGNNLKSWHEFLDGGNPRPPDAPSWAERLRQPWF
jgi:HEAT repeat protein